MYIAIDIGGTKTIINGYEKLDPATLVFSHIFKTGLSFDQMLDTLTTIIDDNASDNVSGIGIAHVGVIDQATKECVFSINLPTFERKPLVKHLEERYKTEVLIDNDLVCGGRAEAIFGVGKSYDSSIYFTVSTGVGGAFVYKADGGHRVVQIEAGQFAIKGVGMPNGAGQVDTIESYVGGRSMEQRFLRKPEDIKDLLLWENQVSYLATAVINCIIMFSPDIFILGGGMIENNDYLREKLIIEAQKGLKIKPFPTVKISRMGKNVVVHGALSLLCDASGAD